jgi:dipeptidyl-peptidase 4
VFRADWSLRAFAALLVLASVVAPVASAGPKELRLEEIFAEPGISGPSPTQLRWSPDGRWLSYILPQADAERRDLWGVDPVTGEKRILVSYEQLASLAPPAAEAAQDERDRERLLRYAVAAYLWSPDSQSILFTSAGQLYVYDLASGEARALAPAKRGVGDPKFSPNGRWVSFVYEHDLWLVPASGGEDLRLTTGASETLLHGDLDWVYPEEFGIRSGYHWSPDSRHIAFLELDQSPVPRYPITDLTSIRPSFDLQRYPKAGDPNPRARIGIVEARPSAEGNSNVLWLGLTAEYVPRFSWVDAGRVAVQLLNREQNELRIVFADAVTGETRSVLTERSDAWINISNDLHFLPAREEFLWTTERSGFRHIELYGFDGERKRVLTQGEWEVSGIQGVEEQAGWVYFISNEDQPLGKDLYRVRLYGSAKERLTKSKGTHAVTLSPKAGGYADLWSSLSDVPRLEVRHLASGRTTEIHRNPPMDEYNLVVPELLEWTTPDKALVRAQLLKPPVLEAGRKYPLLVYVYGGPRAPTIRDAWGDSRGRDLFHQYLVKKGYVVASIDDRASSLLGHRYEATLRHAYGPTALKDYLFGVEQLTSMDFIDGERVGIWGWSGGGFSTCFALTHSKRFKVGIAVAPVTDWRLYDTIYTERYMGLPEANEAAYNATSAVKAAKDLSGRLLLVHGTADDNVHLQNTIQMIDALIEAGKPYDLLVYPGKTHSIHGTAARLHLFRAIEKYLDDHL